MQIDFHHAVTYVIARHAGFDHAQAEIIAYCSQYVDDATNSGTITFETKAMYTRIYSAHKMLDPRNFNELSNHHVWIPFHFLPGNGGEPADRKPSGGFIERIICRPDSFVAGDMLRACIADRAASYGLHRLGITMHVYADTWAHQGFAGVSHEVNSVSVLDDIEEPAKSAWKKFKEKAEDVWSRIKSKFVKNTLPLGHGCALTFPDMPYLQWQYKDYLGHDVNRNNTEDFMKAADAMCRAMQRYRANDPDAAVSGLPPAEREKIRSMLSSIIDVDGDKRHMKWLEAIGQGHFGFGAVNLRYQAKGLDSWKYEALGTEEEVDAGDEKFPYDPSFLKSNWKLFHDALQAHRFTVIYDILPRYGICAA